MTILYKKRFFSSVQYSTVLKFNFEFKNGILDPKNPFNDVSDVKIGPIEAIINFYRHSQLKILPTVELKTNKTKVS